MTASRLTPADVAQRLNCSTRLVRDLIISGTLPAVDVSRPGSRKPRYRVSETDILVFEQRRLVRTVPATKRKRKKKHTNVMEFF